MEQKKIETCKEYYEEYLIRISEMLIKDGDTICVYSKGRDKVQIESRGVKITIELK